LKHGHKKETFRKNDMPGLQRDQLSQPQIQNDGRQAGIVKVLQHLQKAHQTQGSQEIESLSRVERRIAEYQKIRVADFL